MEHNNVLKNDNKEIGKIISKTVLYIALIALAILCFLPFFIMIINATHTNGEIATTLSLTPGTSLMANYHRLLESQPIWNGLVNSVVIAIAVTAVSGYFSALTAYGFSKFRFKGNKILFWVLLGTMMIPTQLGMIGLFQLVKKLGLLDSYLPLIIPAIATPASVFFIKGYTDGAISRSLIEAARIDGCSEFKIFNRIVLPLIFPSVATMSIFTFIQTWNNFLIPLILLFDPTKFTLPIMVMLARGTYQTEYGAVFAGVAISIVPIMIAFIFLSKKIVGGLTVGGVKG
ncbi:carbohydrate ABC transporter permease [Clostridium estertheticum]|uniref:Sugar ABC transporter permease n=2 Tax=Clostridium estertheticum TaxID=238834 RepID=A0A1J0GHB0_9CLOT|nr:carbohydrate ABC transporter permease [Clostridium estertheticum]APC40286.1 sugar ABC transporter permease [Clostridium estertheticum subsp. estertheticum]MBU3170529.1 carbohydrate ABC transporter permease [Clostridium estertheticum]MBW9172050.1 carbohydrate ABC transporter permease [Clostridium estertheticum]MBX4262413.1 carbohydrate ABC transporter permease [Clostridium estertheticum]MBZ9617910.1 carbohydrate ABC transporter permease [Clostridium estertheticum subsp. laramiense]